jgi:hypothetical protein
MDSEQSFELEQAQETISHDAECSFPKKRVREADDDYPYIVAMLNDENRVIEGTCGIQWIIQRRTAGKKNWNSISYCGTKEGLLLYLPKTGCDPQAMEIIHALPPYFPKR